MASSDADKAYKAMQDAVAAAKAAAKRDGTAGWNKPSELPKK